MNDQSLRAALPSEAPSGFAVLTLDALRRQGRAKWSVGPPMLGAGVAEMDFAPPRVVTAAMEDAIRKGDIGYPHAAALDAASLALVQWLRRHHGWDVHPGRVLTIGDVVSALETTLLYITDRSAPVVVPTPAYPPLLSIPRALGHRVIEVPLVRVESGWRHDLTALDRAFASGARTLLLCNPHNPTGTVFPRAELREVADIVQRWGGRVFADEIHSPLIYRRTAEDRQESAYAPYGAVSTAAATHAIVGMSATKGWNVGGIKAAHVIFADADADLLRPLAARLAHGASTPGLWGTAAAYNHGDRWREDALVYLDRNRALMRDLVGTWLPGVTFRVPDAGYLAWLDFSGTPWADLPAQRARLRAFVDANEGIDFGEAGAGHLRINFATSADILELIVRSLGDALSSDRNQSPMRLRRRGE